MATNQTQTERRKAGWEQHLTAALQVIAVAGIMFIGSQFWGMNNKLTEFSITNKYLVESVNDLKIQIRDLNTSYVNKGEFKDLEIRVRTLENRK